jgi:hypothetical protein
MIAIGVKFGLSPKDCRRRAEIIGNNKRVIKQKRRRYGRNGREDNCLQRVGRMNLVAREISENSALFGLLY